MVCIDCGSKTQVINSRAQKRANQVWRRRQCANCQAVFTTQESVELQAAWLIHKNGRYTPFVPEKLLLSLHRSLKHRPTALQDAIGLQKTVISKLAPLAKNGQLQAANIVQVAQIALNRFDKAASTNYAAYHQPH